MNCASATSVVIRWRIIDGGGNPVTCAQAGATQLDVFVASYHVSQSCPATASSGSIAPVSGGLPAGHYTVDVILSGQSLHAEVRAASIYLSCSDQPNAPTVDLEVTPACLSTNATGFAWNVSNPCPRDAGAPCYAACTLNGAQYVGCVSGSTVGTECYSSCSACP
jgi:hypothetical protein